MEEGSPLLSPLLPRFVVSRWTVYNNNNEDSAGQCGDEPHAHQLGGLNHRRGISNSTDYVLITLVGIAKNVE